MNKIIDAEGSVYSISWSYDDQFITATSDGVVKIWSVETGILVATLGLAISVDFSPTSYEVAYIDKTQAALVIENVDYIVVPAFHVSSVLMYPSKLSFEIINSISQIIGEKAPAIFSKMFFISFLNQRFTNSELSATGPGDVGEPWMTTKIFESFS